MHSHSVRPNYTHQRASNSVGVVAKAAISLSAVYILFLLYTIFSHGPSPRSDIRSPHRKTLARGISYWKKVDHLVYRDFLPELLSQPAPHYVLFVSGAMEGTEDQPWCGDCYAAEPVVRDLVSKAGGSLLEVSVGTMDEWHKDDHPVRVDPEAPIKYIPTLYHWSKAGPGARISNQLNSDETPEKLKEIVATFLKETAGHLRTVVSATQMVLEKKGKACNHC